MEKVLEILLSCVGYLEKKSNKDLEHKTKNAGNKNYTIFGKLYEEYMGVKGFINAYWCMMFISVCFVKAYGLEIAKNLLCGNLWAYCPFAMSAFKKSGRLHTKPKSGDLVFFIKNGVARHVGYVTKVSGNNFNSIEGNTSGASGVIANGGGVCKKSYTVNSNMRFGRPDYSIISKTSAYVPNKPTETKKETTGKLTKAKLIKAVQKAICVTVDGIVGKQTIAALPTLKNGSEGEVVKLLQQGLQDVHGITVAGGVDGDFGNGTEKAVKAFQKNKQLEVDGIVGANTWKKFLA